MDLQNLRIALFDALKPYGDEEGHDMRMNQTKHAHVLIQSLMAFLHILKKHNEICQASFRELSLSDCCGGFLRSLGRIWSQCLSVEETAIAYYPRRSCSFI